MKCAFAVLGAFLLLNIVHADEMKFWNEMVECGHEMGITPDQLKDMAAAKDEKLGCIKACVMKKLGLMVGGKLHMDNLIAMLDKMKDEITDLEKTKEDLHGCYDQAASGDLPECQMALKFATCMHDHMQG